MMASVHWVPEWIRLRDRGITTAVALARDASQKVLSSGSRGVTACTATGHRLHSPRYYLGQRKDLNRMTLDHSLHRCLRAAWPAVLHRAGAQETVWVSLRWPHTLVQYLQDLPLGSFVLHPTERTL